ncbi:MAG: class I SAM-dependent methyltransferase [Synergistaceae bacterium]|nr:class I SAM-dependent methyltransferase [Synergistaceae bacterium]
MNHSEAARQNKRAWEHEVYEWRVKAQGSPESVADAIRTAPGKFLRCHEKYFFDVKGRRIASICGSDGRRACALAVLGAEATVFDISEAQKRYALELAEALNVKINYEVCDFCSLDRNKYASYFDYAYAEGGILHYFHDIDLFFAVLYSIIKGGGILVLSDYHPFRKAIAAENPSRNIEKTGGNYFDSMLHEGHVPYKKFFGADEQADFPECLLRFYTLSEIINAALRAGFIIKEFNEHPKHDDGKLPGEFTLIAQRQ